MITERRRMDRVLVTHPQGPCLPGQPVPQEWVSRLEAAVRLRLARRRARHGHVRILRLARNRYQLIALNTLLLNTAPDPAH